MTNAVPLSTTRSVVKSNKIEDYEHVLTFLWDADIGDPSNLILRIDCTKRGMMEFLQFYPRQNLKGMSTTNENYTRERKYLELQT